MPRESKGVWKHSLIETLLVVFLVGVGKFTEDSPALNFLFRKHQYLKSAALLGAGAVMVLAFLYCWEWIVGKWPVKLGRVGKINGYWLDAIYPTDSGELKMGSVIHMECSSTGFRVYGWSYDYVNGELIPAKPGSNYFEGAGIPSETGSSCFYHYTGFEGRPDDGIGRYDFRLGSPRKGDVEFEGYFLSPHLGEAKAGEARVVLGRKVKGSEEQEFRKDAGQTLLKKHLQECPPYHAAVPRHATNLETPSGQT
jgi:hypothetical protein